MQSVLASIVAGRRRVVFALNRREERRAMRLLNHLEMILSTLFHSLVPDNPVIRPYANLPTRSTNREK
jgi:hypothetical protein